MPQTHPSGKGLLPSPTGWSSDQHHSAMLTDVSRFIMGRTEGCRLEVGQLVRTHTGKCLKCQSSSDGHSDHSALCPKIKPRFPCRFSSRFSHTSDLGIGTLVAPKSDAFHYRVSTRTGWPGVRVMCFGEIANFICNFCLNVAARVSLFFKTRMHP